MYKVYSEPLSRHDYLFYYSIIVPFLTQSSQAWTHQSAVMLLEEGSCPLCARLLLCCYPGEVQLSERHQGAKNNMVKNLNNKLLEIQGCAASRLPLTFPKRIVQNLSIHVLCSGDKIPELSSTSGADSSILFPWCFLSTFLQKLVFQKK